MHDENLPDNRRNPRQVLLVVQFLRNEKIRACNRNLHKPCQPEERQNGPHNCLLPRSTLVEIFHLPGTSPRHTRDSLQSIGTLYAKFPSSREFSKPTQVAVPTKSPAPASQPHPRRRIGFRRSKEIAFRASIPRVTTPAGPRPADPAAAPVPSRAAPGSAPAIARSVCRTCTPRQKTTIPARAALSRPCTHSPAKACSTCDSMPRPTLLCESPHALCLCVSALSFFPCGNFHLEALTHSRPFSPAP